MKIIKIISAIFFIFGIFIIIGGFRVNDNYQYLDFIIGMLVIIYATTKLKYSDGII